MKLKLQKFQMAFGAALMRFPWVVLCSVVGTGTALCMLYSNTNKGLGVVMSCALGLPLFLALQLLREHGGKWMRWPWEILPVGLLVLQAWRLYSIMPEHVDYLPSICISYKLKAGNSLESYISELNKQPDKDKLSTYLQTNATLCNHCGLSTCKAHVEYFLCYPHGSERHWHFENVDKTVFKAGGLEIRRGCRYHQEKVNNAFTDDEIAVLKRLIDIRFTQIDNL